MVSRVLRDAPPRRYVVCARKDLAPGEARTFRAGSRSLAVVCLEEGSYRAVTGTCPHEAASLAKGKVEKMWTSETAGEHRSSERCVIVCPWHNFEFDLDTGLSPCEPGRKDMSLRTYRAVLEDGEVVVYA